MSVGRRSFDWTITIMPSGHKKRSSLHSGRRVQSVPKSGKGEMSPLDGVIQRQNKRLKEEAEWRAKSGPVRVYKDESIIRKVK